MEFAYSEAGMALTKGFEGLRLEAYRDSGGVWTVGYGHTCEDVRAGVCVTEFEAEVLLWGDLAEAVGCVNRAVTAKVSQGQFDALVDFCFNAGAAKEFGKWVHVGGVAVAGLVRRRKAEAEMFANEAPTA